MTNKDLISQYVDTGLKLPEYQVIQLPSWAVKTYIRKRLMNGILIDFEFDMLSDLEKNKYLDNILQNHNKYWAVISPHQFEMLPDGEIKDKIRRNIIDNIEGSLLAGETLSVRDREFIKTLGV